MKRPTDALQYLETNERAFTADLASLVAIPSISTDRRHGAEIRACAELVCQQMKSAGLQAKLVDNDSHQSNPIVYGEWTGAGPSAVTIFLYCHYDVQPPDPLDKWHTKPFVLTPGPDDRLYGRGACDDKGAIVAFMASVAACLRTSGLPINIKMMVEGEEETGSASLPIFLDEYREQIGHIDVIGIADTENLQNGLPCLTCSLRGVFELLVRTEALDRPVHSGNGGGLLPDPVLALSAVLARLADVPSIPGLSCIPALSAGDRLLLKSLPRPSEGELRRNLGLLEEVPFAVNLQDVGAYEQTWFRPAVNIIAMRAGSIDSPSNQVLPGASALVSIRTAPGQDTAVAIRGVTELLLRDPPNGVKVSVKVGEAPIDAWKSDITGPFLQAASSALLAGYGREPLAVGCGGSIGVVGPLTSRLAAPAVLLGIEDPRSNPHAPNESLDRKDWRRLMETLVHFYNLL